MPDNPLPPPIPYPSRSHGGYDQENGSLLDWRLDEYKTLLDYRRVILTLRRREQSTSAHPFRVHCRPDQLVELARAILRQYGDRLDTLLEHLSERQHHTESIHDSGGRRTT